MSDLSGGKPPRVEIVTIELFCGTCGEPLLLEQERSQMGAPHVRLCVKPCQKCLDTAQEAKIRRLQAIVDKAVAWQKSFRHSQDTTDEGYSIADEAMECELYEAVEKYPEITGAKEGHNENLE